MYRKVLVPLDGSKTAEAVLAHVQKIAKEGLVGEISLVKVVGRQMMMTDGGAMPVRLRINTSCCRPLRCAKCRTARAAGRTRTPGVTDARAVSKVISSLRTCNKS